MRRVSIVDYGLCNLDSIRRAIEICGGAPRIGRDGDSIRGADMIVLPGVGAFGAAMKNLQATFMAQALTEEVARGVPLLGICLGMQLLASSSTEGGGTGGGRCEGLDLIPGAVALLDGAGTGERVPHMGWNSVTVAAADDPLFKGLPPETNFYFVHSYHFRPTDAAYGIATTPYCGRFTSVVRRDNVCGTQFHPEKSQRAGFRLLENFLNQ